MLAKFVERTLFCQGFPYTQEGSKFSPGGREEEFFAS